MTKKQVDNYREGKLIPCCQLLAELSGKKKKTPIVKHLRGAKYPNDLFVINLPAGGKLNAQSHCFLIITIIADTRLQKRSLDLSAIAADDAGALY